MKAENRIIKYMFDKRFPYAGLITNCPCCIVVCRIVIKIEHQKETREKWIEKNILKPMHKY